MKKVLTLAKKKLKKFNEILTVYANASSYAIHR